MPIEIRWYNEERSIVFVNLNTAWNWTDAADALSQIQEMCGAAPGQVSMIVDVSRLNALLPNYGNQVLSMGGHLPSNLCVIAYVANDFVYDVFSAFHDVYGEVTWNYKLVRTLDEAETVIQNCHNGKDRPVPPPKLGAN